MYFAKVSIHKSETYTHARTDGRTHDFRGQGETFVLWYPPHPATTQPTPPRPVLHLTHPIINPVSPTTHSSNASVLRGDTISRNSGQNKRAMRTCQKYFLPRGSPVSFGSSGCGDRGFRTSGTSESETHPKTEPHPLGSFREAIYHPA